MPMWELRVEGRLLDESAAAAGAAGGTTPATQSASASSQAAGLQRNMPKRKFSSFFKSLVIELDKDIYGPDNHLVEWHRTPQTNETDGFQVRQGCLRVVPLKGSGSPGSVVAITSWVCGAVQMLACLRGMPASVVVTTTDGVVTTEVLLEWVS